MAEKYTKKRHSVLRWILVALALVLVAGAGLPALREYGTRERVARLARAELPAWVEPQLIDVDGASRRGEKLEGLNNIVIHYVGNPGTTATQNRNYYANPDSQVSSHFLVGLEGEVLLCVPLDEKSSATNHRNRDTISIEVCHPDSTGKFTDVTYDSLVRLTAWLLEVTGLKETDVIRHYDVTGKECPRYFVINEESWEVFRADVGRARKG